MENVPRKQRLSCSEKEQNQNNFDICAAVSQLPGQRRTKQKKRKENAARIPVERRRHARTYADDAAAGRAVKSRAFTCCQYSSRDGRAEKYPVSCTIWSSWKMLHMGMTSISLAGMQPRTRGEVSSSESERAMRARGVHTGAGISAVRACMRRSAKWLRASTGRGFGVCDAPTAHNKRTLGKSQRTVNFPPIQNYRQAHPHVITLRFGVSTNEMAGAHHPPTKPTPTNWAPGLTHPARCGWLAASLGSGTHWARRALFLERYIAAWQLSRSLSHSQTHSERIEEVESLLARREMRAAAVSLCSPRRHSAPLGRQTHFASRCAVTHTCCTAGSARAASYELRVSKEQIILPRLVRKTQLQANK